MLIEQWILVIIMSWPTYDKSNRSQKITATFPSKQQCFEALDKAEFKFPNNTTENEWIALKVCLPNMGAKY